MAMAVSDPLRWSEGCKRAVDAGTRGLRFERFLGVRSDAPEHWSSTVLLYSLSLAC